MKKFILPSICFIAFASCKKEHIDAGPTESSTQLLSKITKTADFGGGTLSISYSYNDAGKLIAEGITRYERDDKQRIIRILEPGTPSNRADIEVYYDDANAPRVSYTLCRLTGADAVDSVVYVHDKNGKLTTTMSYLRSAGDNITGTYSLVQYNVFNYDAEGNMVQWHYYNIHGNDTSHCAQYYFEAFDKKLNPLYTDDEVRATSILWGGILTNSFNNCTRMGSIIRYYDYRADGRPRSCIGKLNGTNNYKLIFEYK